MSNIVSPISGGYYVNDHCPGVTIKVLSIDRQNDLVHLEHGIHTIQHRTIKLSEWPETDMIMIGSAGTSGTRVEILDTDNPDKHNSNNYNPRSVWKHRFIPNAYLIIQDVDNDFSTLIVETRRKITGDSELCYRGRPGVQITFQNLHELYTYYSSNKAPF